MKSIKRQITTLAVAVALLAVVFAVLCTPTLAATIFSDDFQDEALGVLPAIAPIATGSKGDVADIGGGWVNSGDGGDDIVKVSDNLLNLGVDDQVAQVHFGDSGANGEVYGALSEDIALNAAVFTFDFRIDGTVNNITVRPVNDGGNLKSIQFQKDGDLIIEGLASLQDFAAPNSAAGGVWYHTVITFTDNLDTTYGVNIVTTHIANATFTDLDFTITALSSLTVIDEIQFDARGVLLLPLTLTTSVSKRASPSPNPAPSS